MNKKKKAALKQASAFQLQSPKQQIRRKKIDPFKTRGINYVDFTDTKFLSRFLNEQGKILPSRITGVSSKMQRQLTLAIKTARHLGLLPFVSDEFKS